MQQAAGASALETRAASGFLRRLFCWRQAGEEFSELSWPEKCESSIETSSEEVSEVDEAAQFQVGLVMRVASAGPAV